MRQRFELADHEMLQAHGRDHNVLELHSPLKGGMDGGQNKRKRPAREWKCWGLRRTGNARTDERRVCGSRNTADAQF